MWGSWAAFDELSGLYSTPMRWTVGNISVSISTRFPHISEIISDIPVRLAPGDLEHGDRSRERP